MMKSNDGPPIATYLASLKKLLEWQFNDTEFLIFYTQLIHVGTLIQVENDSEAQEALNYLKIMKIAAQHVQTYGYIYSTCLTSIHVLKWA
jgi:hypothetical protein